MNKSLFFIVILMFGINSYAAEKSTKVKIQFDEDLVKGINDVPSGSRTMTRKDFNFKKMIKIRENFIPEIEGTGGHFENK